MSLKRLFGLGRKKSATHIKRITVYEAHDLCAKGAITLIDVRGPDEWAKTGRPVDSHGVTLQDPDFLIAALAAAGGDKDRPVAFSCLSGKRSLQAAEKALAAGHTDIFNVEGGLLAWADARLPLARDPS
ncbi:rhodanese-like domain-containing protein [Eilatimonas milleporae]|uniref:Rhodanese-related sulfurtransferase n=1 Tax=Eilatimonas milleporae TaxID=911205 RepID=A0A3M0CGW0_9PROT|nr:rhodanese-like domain-containing protein [Eilatimonas milleporae]RMB08612.1 rhodanese-related sulfurtransferase [Eilatimonas milleporae]